MVTDRSAYPIVQTTRYLASFLGWHVVQSVIPPHFLYHLREMFAGHGNELPHQNRLHPLNQLPPLTLPPADSTLPVRECINQAKHFLHLQIEIAQADSRSRTPDCRPAKHACQGFSERGTSKTRLLCVVFDADGRPAAKRSIDAFACK